MASRLACRDRLFRPVVLIALTATIVLTVTSNPQEAATAEAVYTSLLKMRHASQQFDKITILMLGLVWVRLLPRRRRRHLDH